MANQLPEWEISSISGDATDVRNITGNSIDIGDSYVPTVPNTPVGQGRLITDPDGHLVTRGDVLTDEGSFRDDFSGSALSADWTTTIAGSSTVSVTNSLATLATGTGTSSISIVNSGDYGPMTTASSFSLSQRLATDNIYFGFRDAPTSPSKEAVFHFTGTVNTVLNCISRYSTASTDVETTSTITIPNNGTTATSHIYTIDVTGDAIAFFVDGVQVALHKTHIPAPYDAMDITFYASKTAGTSTSIPIDFCFFTNQNNLQITNTFDGSPVSVAVREDVHYVTGNITTTTTTADQTIVQVTVPTNKVMYLTGYSVNSSNVAATLIKIGKSTLTEPGTSAIDSIVYRAFPLAGSGSRYETMPMSMRVGQAGDIVKIVVTPAATQSTVWRATIDYVLR